MKKRIFCAFLAVLFAIIFVPEVKAEEKPNSFFEGKTVSILGDSISTFGGVSNNEKSNSTIGSNASYYTGQGGIGLHDTWWQQTADILGMELLVNNSWSGSCVFQPRKGEASVGYTNRCVNLHNDLTGEEPDVILVFLGTNDFKSCYSTIGTEAEVDYGSIITENGDGTFSYATAETSFEAYAIMLHKMKNRYPDAKIYCMNLLPRKSGSLQPTAFNADLAVIAGRFGCKIIDLENCGFSPENLGELMYDGAVHPNSEGMDLITEAVASALLEREIRICDVDVSLSNVVADNSFRACIAGGKYELHLSPINPEEKADITVTMGGNDVTSACLENGKIVIEKVTGDISVTAEAERGNLSFRWEYSGGELVSVSESGYSSNKIVKIKGSSENGVFSDTYYRTQHTVMLEHDREWTLEWKGSGKGGFVLADKATAASSNIYFRRHTIGSLHVFGYYDGNQYNHYGVAPKNFGFDVNAEHIYRMENRIDQSGNNMVYFYVDNVEIGPMNNYYVGYQNQNTTDNWISGKDFCINYIGTSSHPISDYYVEYLAVWEEGKPISIADINLDGFVNVYDAYYARLVAAKLIKPTEEQLSVGDVDLDGKITAIDANIIRKYTVGIITELPVNQTK